MDKMQTKSRHRRHHFPERFLLLAVMLFLFSGFLLLSLREPRWQGFALAIGVPLVIRIISRGLPRLFPCDELLLTIVNFLCGLGILVLYATNPSSAYRQVIFYAAGLPCMVLCLYLVRIIPSWHGLTLLLIPVSLLLLALPLAIGRETYGARNWIQLGGMSLQPSELVKISLLLILAQHMTRHRLITWLLFALGCLALLMLQKDLGTALLYYGTILLMFYAASGSIVLTGLGLASGAGAAILGYKMFAHVKRRVAAWQNPWADFENAGYQLGQALMAIASGGMIGVGLGLGAPTSIPVYETDFIFAVICEQFGVIFGLCVLLLFAVMIWRGAGIALNARRSFHSLLAAGITILLALQTFVIIGGVIKLIPLTGVTLPFVSAGGSSMISSMCLIGLLQGVQSLNQDDHQRDLYLSELQFEEDLT